MNINTSATKHVCKRDMFLPQVSRKGPEAIALRHNVTPCFVTFQLYQPPCDITSPFTPSSQRNSWSLQSSVRAAVPMVSLNQLLSDLQHLLEWKSPRLYQDGVPRHHQDLQPGFYERHLAPDLALRHVRALPSIIPAITRCVDQRIAASAREIGKRYDPGLFLSARDLRTRLSQHPSRTTYPVDVCDYYKSTAGFFFSSVASILALHPQEGGGFSLFSSTPAPKERGWTPSDALFTVMKDNISGFEKIYELIFSSMDTRTRKFYRHICDTNERVLGIWHFLDVERGSHIMTRDLPNLFAQDAFPWYPEPPSVSGAEPRRHRLTADSETLWTCLSPDGTTPTSRTAPVDYARVFPSAFAGPFPLEKIDSLKIPLRRSRRLMKLLPESVASSRTATEAGFGESPLHRPTKRRKISIGTCAAPTSEAKSIIKHVS